VDGGTGGPEGQLARNEKESIASDAPWSSLTEDPCFPRDRRSTRGWMEW
jgi:hypothetical protein